ncbi:Flagellar basal-body rod protein FlgF [Andreprevotia sp. IGB-42]|uniref:flagellar basal-body rod protein FlgF n=1 Tax=Andreprevotia sp. IGB-42 TaxID=2497473 RepID=UPI00135BA3FB|nr:flagellar basal-body rod protein FlgF [Andreprevotia sp. IGB-42]KAF0812515.1 Flagellar basal-body rod protein FlgF [Andreprevotia sp. IGB-42]
MDRLIYTAMSGAKHTMLREATVANNLANAATPGFRAELAAFRAVPALGGSGMPTRAFVVEQSTGSDLSPGILQATGRDLDVAVNGDGWLTVQTPTGEAYTRNGGFEIDATGLLKTRNGLVVQGENGPLTIPENNRISISQDGTVTGTDLSNPSQSVEIGRLKLVNPAAQNVEKGYDGLFRLKSGDPAPVATDVKLAGGMLETSNVNTVDQLVTMVSAQRQYDFQIKLLQTADQNARSAAQLMTFN